MRASVNLVAWCEAAKTVSAVLGHGIALIVISVQVFGALIEPLVRALTQATNPASGRGRVGDRGGILMGHHAAWLNI